MPDYLKWDKLIEVRKLIEHELNRKNKLKVAKVAYKHQKEGDRLKDIADVLSVNHSTLGDWIAAYEMYTYLPKGERDNYSITALKKMRVKDRNKIKHPDDNSKDTKPLKKKLKCYKNKEYKQLLKIYSRLKCYKISQNNLKGVYHTMGLILAESRNQLNGEHIVEEYENEKILKENWEDDLSLSTQNNNLKDTL